MDSNTVPFSIKTDGIITKVEIDGEDWSGRTQRIVFEHAARETARLGIELAPGQEGILEGEAIVEVLRTVDVDQREIVRDWLSNIDPSVVSAEVLKRATGLRGPNPVEATMALLMEWASDTA